MADGDTTITPPPDAPIMQPASDTLPEVDVNATPISDMDSSYSQALGQVDPLLGRVEKAIQAEEEPKAKAWEAAAEQHRKISEQWMQREADLSQQMADWTQKAGPEMAQYIEKTPNRQGIYAANMHIAPMLAILSAVGGKMARTSGLQMLAATTGAVQGLNQGNEQAYAAAMDQWKAGFSKFQAETKMQQQYYTQMLKAYGGRADAEEKAAAAAERMSGNIRTDEQKKLATAAQAIKSQMQVANQLEHLQLAREGLDIQRQKLALQQQKAAGALPEGWDQSTIDFYAERGLRGDYSWRVGLSRSAGGAAVIAAIDKRAAELASERNIAPSEAATIPGTSKGLTHSLQERQSYLEAVKPAVTMFNEQAQIVRDMLKTGAGGQSPLWNKYQQYARGQIAGDADVSALETALVGAGREHQRIITGPKSNAQMHQGAADRADQLLNINQSPSQILRNLDVMQREGQNFIEANQEEVQDIRRQIRDLGSRGGQLDIPMRPPAWTQPGGAAPRAPAPAAAAPPPVAVDHGTGATFQTNPDGSRTNTKTGTRWVWNSQTNKWEKAAPAVPRQPGATGGW